MDREYDLSEKLPNDQVLWHCAVQGIENAIARLKQLAAKSSKEHFALHTPTKAVVARVNVRDAPKAS